jgi:hypothetical protein
MKAKKLIETYKGILDELNSENVVLAGSCALELMGVNLPKEPEDLDVIIYQPTFYQNSIIVKYSSKCVANNKNIIEEYRRVVKLEISPKLFLDIIIEDYPLTHDCLLFDGQYNIQPVNKIMEARGRYLRPKDYASFLDLKNLNFNYK